MKFCKKISSSKLRKLENWKKSNKLLENKPVFIDFSLRSDIQLFTVCDKFISIGESRFCLYSSKIGHTGAQYHKYTKIIAVTNKI